LAKILNEESERSFSEFANELICAETGFCELQNQQDEIDGVDNEWGR